ncbi:MAG: DNA double-strand break repair nuclease NurA [FCB group bacterium]|nr:DNA double-strand break repair nuclease NurA [FCB group bacterium]
MPLETFEHNRLESSAARAAARDLIGLFDPSENPPFPPESSFGAPPLVDDVEAIPRVSIPEKTETGRVYAVDGGSSVLAKGGNIEVVAWRAGMVVFKGTQRLSESCPPPEIRAYNRLNAPNVIREYLIDDREDDDAGETIVRLVDDLRYLTEWRMAEQIIDEAEADSIILMDGNLRVNPVFGSGMEKRILLKAGDKGVHVAAVTKETRLSQNFGAPLDINAEDKTKAQAGVWNRRISKPLPESSPWLGDLYQTCLHPCAEKLYLIYINRYDTAPAIDLFSALAGVSDDVEFCGYPYPLAAAHRLARIDSSFKTIMQERVGAALEQAGFSSQKWDYLKGDIHIKLNADLQALAGGV